MNAYKSLAILAAFAAGSTTMLGCGATGSDPESGSVVQTSTAALDAETDSASRDRWDDVSFLMILTGRTDVFQCEVPPTDKGTTVADCHTHSIYDLRTGKVIGVATDSSTDDVVVNGETVVVGTTFFTFTEGPFKGSKIVTRGAGTIAPQPVQNAFLRIPGLNPPSPAGKVDAFAAIPNVFGADGKPANMVLSSSGKLAGAKGTIALWGQIDTSQLPKNANFNCMFSLDLKVPRHP